MTTDKEETPVTRTYSVMLHGKYNVAAGITRGKVKVKARNGTPDTTYSTAAKLVVIAPDWKGARELALKAHANGKVHWYNAPVFDVTVEKKDVRLDVPTTVLDHYLAGTDEELLTLVFNQSKTKSPQGMYFGYEMRRNGPMAHQGTWRYSYGSGFLFSYNMKIAFRTTYSGKPFVLVNGDGAPTKATNDFMASLRGKLNPRGWEARRHRWRSLGPPVPHAFIPFSVLDQARIKPEEVTVLATTLDRTTRVKAKIKNRESGLWEDGFRTRHFLGETLFLARGKVFVCGLDRGDDPSKRMFYMCQIPVPAERKHWPKTVDEALALLRPEGLPKNSKRQGEWFFVPQAKYKPVEGVGRRGRRIPILTDEAPVQVRHILDDGTVHPSTVSGRASRHVASSLLVNGAVYAKGIVTDAEHSTLRLGPVWHKVVKNLAIEGWRYVPTGPGAGARVD